MTGPSTFLTLRLLALLFILVLSGAYSPCAYATTLANGQTVTGSVSGTTVNAYSIDVQTDNSFMVSVSETGTHTANFEFVLELVDPGSVHSSVTGPYFTNSFVEHTSSPGTWTINVSSRHGESASYSLTWIKIPGAFSISGSNGGGVMYPDATYTDSVNKGAIDIWTVEQVAGSGKTSSLTLANTGGAGSIPQVWVVAPTGQVRDLTWTSSSTTRDISPVISGTNISGTYIVVVSNHSVQTDTTASYSLSVTGNAIVAPQVAKSDGDCAPCEQKLAAASPPVTSTGRAQVGDPINVATGNLYEQVTDYTTVGANPLAFIRSYNSQSYMHGLYPTLMGANWRTNYDRYLRIISSTAGPVAAERADGRVVNFTLVGSTWTPDTDVDMTLTKSSATWTLKDSDDTTETYTAPSSSCTQCQGVLQTITTRNGYALTMHYTSGRLTSVTDSYSRTLTFTNPSGLITAMTTPDSLTLTYVHTAVGGSNVLTSVIYNDGTADETSQAYLYENTALPFALTGITDENGDRYVTWAYDGAGRAISSKRGGALAADLTQISYDDPAAGKNTVTYPLGEEDTFEFTTLQSMKKVFKITRAAIGSASAVTRDFTYDSNGYLNYAEDWNENVTAYTNNSKGLPTKIEEKTPGGTPVMRTTDLTYDTTFGRLPKTVTTQNLLLTNNYDSAGNLTSRVLDDTTSGSTEPNRTWTYTWNGTGQLLTAQMPRTDNTVKTTYAYSGGKLTSITRRVTSTVNQVTTINTSTGGGLPTQITDPNSVVTNLAYDPRLRLNTSGLVTSGGTLTTTWTHDDAGNLTKLTLPDGSFSEYTYDDAHRVIKLENNAGTPGYTQNYTLDAAGNITQNIWKDSSGTDRYKHAATFDAANRQITSTILGATSPDDQTTAFEHDANGNLTKITDPLSHATNQTFDALNRLSTVTEPSPLSGVTTYAYDAHDRITNVEDQRGHDTTYTYNGFGDLTQQTSPDFNNGLAITYDEYDADSNLKKRTDAQGRVMNVTYDALDRPATRTFTGDSSLDVDYTYDINDASHGDGIGRLVVVHDEAGTLSLAYEERGLVTKNDRILSSTHYTTHYDYDDAGRIAKITYPLSAWEVNYTRNSAGLVTAVTATPPGGSASNIATSIVHFPFGPVKTFTYGNSIADSRQADFDYRITRVQDTITTTGDYQKLTYTLDDAGNPTTIADAVTSGNTQTLAYDNLDRLTSASGVYGNFSALTYDATGNRLTSVLGGVTTTNTYTSYGNGIKTAGAATISRSNAGNVKAIGSDTINYNYAQQVSSTVIGGTTTSYTYDAFGQRLTSLTGSTTSTLHYGLGNEILSETTGSAQTHYVWLEGLPLAAINTAGSGTISYLHPDRIGTVQKASNASKTTVWTGNYNPFGAVTPTTSITMNLRMPGQYADANGFYHNGFRTYNPAWGRYLEYDPIGMAGGINPYTYALNNPYKNTDPLGLDIAPPGYWPIYTNPPVDSDTGLDSMINQGATMDRGESCFAICAGGLYSSPGMDVAQATSAGAAVPIPKSTFGFPQSLGSGPNTTLGSVLGHYGRDLPQSPIAILGTKNICRIAARANEFAVVGEGIYDTSAIASCMASCKDQ